MSNRSCFICRGLFSREGMTRRGTKFYCQADASKVLVGSDGKARVTSQKNETFTINRFGLPLGTPAYIGFDSRFQASPEEVKAIKQTGFYSQQWRQLRSKT